MKYSVSPEGGSAKWIWQVYSLWLEIAEFDLVWGGQDGKAAFLPINWYCLGLFVKKIHITTIAIWGYAHTIPYSISCIHGQLSCMMWTLSYPRFMRLYLDWDRGDAVSLRYRNRTEITVLMSLPAEALWFPRRRKSYKVRCRVKIALVSSSRVPFQEGLNGVVAWRLNVSNFDGWRLNFRLFDGWRLTPMTPSFRAEIKPKSCPDGSPLEAI